MSFEGLNFHSDGIPLNRLGTELCSPVSRDPCAHPGHQFSVTLLSKMQCCIRPSSNTGHWKATVDWTDEDERLCPAVAPFLDAFGEA
mmetsp:Transcript_13263/g.42782  ORF Transcript_13263/g.42782 Transcript_13263/m.42782 type:complete len:87 (+) Transcript_13263:1708-1968(+)